MASAIISETIRPAYLWTGTEWVQIGDGGADAGSAITVSETAPLDPSEGDAWFNNTDGSLYIYDGSFWVEPAFISGGGGGTVTNERIQDAAALLFNHNLHENLTVIYDDDNNRILLFAEGSVSSVNGASGNVILSTSEIDEGTNLYFTNQRAIDATIETIQSASAYSLGEANNYTDSAVEFSVSTASTAVLDFVEDTYLPFSGGTVTGQLIVEGDFIASGSTTFINATDLKITDPLIYIAVEQYAEDLLDVGFTAAYGVVGMDEENHLHRGFVYDISEEKWRLFSNVPHPEGNYIDFDNANFDILEIGTLETEDIVALGIVSASAFVGDGSQLTGIVSLPDQEDNSGKFLTTDGTDASWETIGQLPTGGTIGQYLVKNSSTNYDASGSNLSVPDETPHPFLLMGG